MTPMQRQPMFGQQNVASGQSAGLGSLLPNQLGVPMQQPMGMAYPQPIGTPTPYNPSTSMFSKLQQVGTPPAPGLGNFNPQQPYPAPFPQIQPPQTQVYPSPYPQVQQPQMQPYPQPYQPFYSQPPMQPVYQQSGPSGLGLDSLTGFYR